MADKKPKVYVSSEPGWDRRSRMLDGLRQAGYAVLEGRPARIPIGEDIEEVKRVAEQQAWQEADYVIVVLTGTYLGTPGVLRNLNMVLRRELAEGRTIILPAKEGNAWNTSLLPGNLRIRAAADLTVDTFDSAMTELIEGIEHFNAKRSGIEPAAVIAEPPAGPTPVTFDDELINSIRRGVGLLYAGAGLSAPAGLPVWIDLAEALVSSAAAQGIISDQDREFFTKASQEQKTDYVVDEIVSRAPPPFIMETLSRLFLGKTITAAHTSLLRIPFAAALTTNFDDLLEQTFSARMSGTSSFTPKDIEALLGALTRNQFFVLKLYGSLDRPETLLVSPAQFDDAVSQNQPFRNFIESLFVSRTILFVGCSLEGIDTYLRGLRFRGQSTKKHYALSGVIGTPYEATAGVLLRRYNIQVIPYRLKDDADLANALRVLVEKVGPRSVAAEALRAAPVGGTPSTLRKIVLNDIGPFRGEHEIVLDPNVTVFLGNNGVGKSTLLRAVAAAVCGKDAEVYAGRLLSFNTPTGSVRLETERSTYQFVVQKTTAGVEVTSLPVRPLEPEGWLVIGFPPLRTTSGGRPSVSQAESLTIPNANDVLPILQGPIDSRLDDVQTWIVNLDYRAKDNPGDTRFRRAIDKFFEVAGILTSGIKLEFQGVDSATRRIRVVTDDGPVPLDALSQGTASLMACVGVVVERLYEVYGNDKDPTLRPVIVLMDEIDAHMHPAWQRSLISRLRQCFPNMQLIATSHSPLIVAGLEKENVYRLLRTGDDHHVEIRQYDMRLKGQEIDDLLASPLFSLDDTRDFPTVEAERRYEKLCELEHPTAWEAEERDSLEMELYGPRGKYARLHDSLDAQIRAIPEDEQLRRLKAADEMVQQLAEGDESL